MKWTAALQAIIGKLVTARPNVTAEHQLNPSTHQPFHKLVRRPRMLVGMVSSAGVITIGVLGFSSHISHTSSWLQVFRNGQYIGLVPNTTQVTSHMQRIADGFGVDFQTKPIRTQVPQNYNWQAVESFPTPAAEIQLNNRTLVYTTSVQAADHVLQTVKRDLTADVQSASDMSSAFVGHVGVVASTVGVANILQPEDAVRLLIHASNGNGLAGRSSSPAAKDLQSLSSQSNSSVVQPGTKSLLTVQTKATVTKSVPVHYSVTYVKTTTLAKGETKVVKPGENGEKRETLQVTYVNGQQSSAKVLSEKDISAPVNEVVDEGTNSGIASGGWVWPTVGHIITSPFGWRSFGGGQFHPGVDIGVPIGTPIFATNNGRVMAAGWNSGGYGNWVEIDNGNGITTVFGHMSRVVAHSGELVTKGELIGYSGETGEATGPHLHYEVRKNGVPVPPLPYT